MKINKVTVIGAGAVGAVIAEPLTNYLGKENVQILAEGERLKRYRKDGLYLNGKKVDFNYVDASQAQKSDLIIIATKNLQLKEAIRMMKKACGPDTLILSLLNGIQSERDIAEVYGEKNVLYGFVLSLNSIHVGNKIEYTNPGAIFFGEKDDSKNERTKAIAELCEGAGIKYSNPDSIQLEQWKKFLINVTFNTLSALCRATYGGFTIDVMQTLARKTGAEVIEIANAEGIPLTQEMLEYDIKLMCSHDPLGKTSMLQDMEGERKSENDWFCGTIVKLGKVHGIETPVCQLLQQLVQGTEESRKIRNPGN